jgi:hypothetical protein
MRRVLGKVSTHKVFPAKSLRRVRCLLEYAARSLDFYLVTCSETPALGICSLNGALGKLMLGAGEDF